MILVVVVIFIVYDLLLISLFIGWLRVIRKEKVNTNARPFISVLVATRNEEQNITKLLDCLNKQTYDNFEVIVIDDHSEDQTVSLVINGQYRFVQSVPNTGVGKKAAITTGVAQARGGIIVTTDADCTMSPEWLETISICFFNTDILMVAAPVKISGEQKFFYNLQQLEFLSVIGTAASTVGLGIPTMCNGANLAYRKETFNEVKGYDGNQQIPSGDDEFLMRKVMKKFPSSFKFLADKKAMVTTEPQRDLSDFINQRVRWAGKWRFNSSFSALFLAIFVVSVQITTLYCYFEIIKILDSTLTFTLITKIVLEAFLLFNFCRFWDMKWRLSSFLVLQIIYPFYVVLVCVLTLSGRYTWKNRTIR